LTTSLIVRFVKLIYFLNIKNTKNIKNILNLLNMIVMPDPTDLRSGGYGRPNQQLNCLELFINE